MNHTFLLERGLPPEAQIKNLKVDFAKRLKSISMNFPMRRIPKENLLRKLPGEFESG